MEYLKERLKPLGGGSSGEYSRRSGSATVGFFPVFSQKTEGCRLAAKSRGADFPQSRGLPTFRKVEALKSAASEVVSCRCTGERPQSAGVCEPVPGDGSPSCVQLSFSSFTHSVVVIVDFWGSLASSCEMIQTDSRPHCL